MRQNSPDVRNVVELRNDRVQQLGASEAILDLHLRRKVTQHDHGRVIRSDEQRPHEQLKVVEPLRVTEISSTKLQIWPCRLTWDPRRQTPR